MLKIGLTGGIASGKSTVAKMLERLGAPIFDADKKVHSLLGKNGDAYEAIKEKFVNELKCDVLDTNDNIDRKKLGTVVFSEKTLLHFLEELLHVKVDESMQGFIKACEETGKPAVVLDIPLLLEKAWQSKVDEIWLVYVPESVQKERLFQREGLSLPEIEKRLDMQMPIDSKRKYADVIIDNTGSQEQTMKNVAEIWRKRILAGDRNATGFP